MDVQHAVLSKAGPQGPRRTRGGLSSRLKRCNLPSQTPALHHSEDFNPMNVKHGARGGRDGRPHITITTGAMTGPRSLEGGIKTKSSPNDKQVLKDF